MHPIPGRAPRQRLLTGAAAVLAVHLLFALVWLRHKPGPDRQMHRRTQAPLLLRLWPLPIQPPTTAAPLPLRTEKAPRAAPAALRRAAAGPAPGEAQAITVPAEPRAITLPAEVVPQPHIAAAASSTPRAPTAPSPLDLRLPDSASAPWRLHNPALDDRRGKRSPLTLEQRLAGAMGGDISQVAEDRLGPDEIRFRRGSDCVLARRSRAGQLGVGNDALRDAWVVGPC